LILIVVAGENSALPHGAPSNRQLAQGEHHVNLLSYGGFYRGYARGYELGAVVIGEAKFVN